MDTLVSTSYSSILEANSLQGEHELGEEGQTVTLQAPLKTTTCINVEPSQPGVSTSIIAEMRQTLLVDCVDDNKY